MNFSENKIVGIVYCTTNLINGKKYIGQDSKNNPNYLGSGLYLKKAILKYGAVNFKKQVIEECESKDDLNEREKYWIDYFGATKSDLFYNIAGGGQGGDLGYEVNKKKSLKTKGVKKTEEFKDKLRIARLNSTYVSSEETRLKISISNKGKKRSEETKAKMSKSFKGRVHSKETISKIKLAKLNSKHFVLESTREKMRLARRGVKLSKETKSKISESHKYKEKSNCVKCGIEATVANIKRWHDEKCGVKVTKKKFKCKYCDVEASMGLIDRWHNENCKLK